MITALIRMEERQLPEEGERLDRLAGRIEAMSLLYRSLSELEDVQEIDLGIYLSQVAAAVMQAHATEGIRLDLKVDTWPVSVNVAMPTGLVVNELLTNTLKHGFRGRDGRLAPAILVRPTSEGTSNSARFYGQEFAPLSGCVFSPTTIY